MGERKAGCPSKTELVPFEWEHRARIGHSKWPVLELGMKLVDWICNSGGRVKI